MHRCVDLSARRVHAPAVEHDALGPPPWGAAAFGRCGRLQLFDPLTGFSHVGWHRPRIAQGQQEGQLCWRGPGTCAWPQPWPSPSAPSVLRGSEHSPSAKIGRSVDNSLYRHVVLSPGSRAAYPRRHSAGRIRARDHGCRPSRGAGWSQWDAWGCVWGVFRVSWERLSTKVHVSAQVAPRLWASHLETGFFVPGTKKKSWPRGTSQSHKASSSQAAYRNALGMTLILIPSATAVTFGRANAWAHDPQPRRATRNTYAC